MSTYTFLADMTALVAQKVGAAGVGSGMQVIIRPMGGRAPYIVPLKAPPVFSSAALGGYSTATVVQGRVSGDVARWLLYADVTIWGRTGPCWFGVVKETERDGTLYCVGSHEVTSWMCTAGQSFTTPTIDDLIRSVFDDSMADWIPGFFPLASRAPGMAWVQTNTLTLTSRTVDDMTIAERIADAVQYSSWQYGWYMERVNGAWKCVPHYAPASTTPEYVVTLSAEDAAEFMGDSLEGMLSRIRARWGDSNSLLDVYDTDGSHYLNAIGRGKAEWRNYSTTMSATDTQIAAEQLLVERSGTKKGRTSLKKHHMKALTKSGIKKMNRRIAAQSKASMTGGIRTIGRLTFGLGRNDDSTSTSRIQTANGLEAYGPSIRAGALVRLVGLPDGPVDLRIASVECTGDTAVSLDLGADSGRLDALLARIA